MGGNSKLTDKAIKAAKPREKPYKLTDGGGLYLLVNPDGSKYWRFKFRVAGREKLLGLGVYPKVSLAGARERYTDERRLLDKGLDPSRQRQQRKRQERVAAANTFEAIGREWHAAKSLRWSENTIGKEKAFLERDLFPWIGHRPIDSIEAADVLECADRVVKRGSLHTATCVLRSAGSVFRFAVAKRLVKSDPTRDLAGALPAAPVNHRSAITDPVRVGELLRAIDGHRGTLVVRTALALSPMLFVRPGELRKALWREFDLDAAAWNIPAERMKMRRPHLVPLSTQAVALLRDLRPLTYRTPDSYVFPGQRTRERPMSENTINAALRGLGFPQTEHTAHGFRAMARTILHEELHFAPDWIEAQLAHEVPDRLGRAYNRTAHLAGRKQMMQAWSDHLDRLRKGADVVVLKNPDARGG